MWRFFFTSSFILALLGTFGCNSAPLPKGAAPAATVTGNVKMDGKAIPTGEIHFLVAGFPPRVLDINDGKYAGEAPIGKNDVQVYIYVEGPPIERYGGQRLKTNTTPSKYWGAETILKATVAADSANEFDFSLTSK